MNSITIIGKRWFNRRTGNTYHSAQILIDGQTIHIIDYAYGYDQAYLDNAVNWLKTNHLIKIDEHEPIWNYCKKNNIKFEYSVSNVQRKSDLG